MQNSFQNGDLLFCREHTFGSWVNRFFQGEFQFSHVCTMYVGKDNNLPYVLTTTATTFKMIPFAEYVNNRQYVVVRHPLLSDGTVFKAILPSNITDYLILHYMKTFYPYITVLKLFLTGLKGQEGPSNISQGIRQASNSSFCSEGVWMAYKEGAGINLTPGLKEEKPELVKPEDLWKNTNWQLIETNIPYYTNPEVFNHDV